MQPILLKVIELGRLSKSNHPEAAQGIHQIMRDEPSKSNAARLQSPSANEGGGNV
jgi:hypothetical protein